jgi:nitronate monooxygenase
MLDRLRIPIVQAPLAGGPSTPELAAAVSNAGALGFVAAGYLDAGGLEEEIAATHALTASPFGVNVFVPSGDPADPPVVEAYAGALTAEAEAAGVDLGEPTFGDDDYEAKLELLERAAPTVISFTFGMPERDVVERLHAAGSAIWVTVTDPGEAAQAAAGGADALVVQGAEAGGHRGAFVDRPDAIDYGLLALIQLVRAETDLPLIATGGIATGEAVAATLVAGAAAAQVGTAFMLCPEAGTSPAQREALATSRPTGLTRAFSGRLARGIVNRFQIEHGASAPIAYPEVNALTGPLRAHGRETGDPEIINLWAGETHLLAEAIPAAEVVAKLDRDARAALAGAGRALSA